ncbi:NAD+ synthase [Candidatus Woesearchaeota archaeon]|nr:NAD+ synthase [Candidatus Woesearchaeota archaeon]
MNVKEIYNALVLGIRDYFKKNNFKKAVIGLSGGLDSSVATCLIVKALGKGNVAAILMPDIGTTSTLSMNHAKKLVIRLDINHYIVPINEQIKYFRELYKSLKFKFKNELYAISNLKARTRMVILYYFANLENALVIGTSDKSEIALGYTTKYGDNAADILVIGDLWKTEVMRLGKFLGVSSSILNKKPSAELVKGVTAEKELGASYDVLDKILKMHIEQDLSLEEIAKKGFNKNFVKNVLDRIRLNEHKRRTAMLIRVSERSFHGMEWRMPITNRFKG